MRFVIRILPLMLLLSACQSAPMPSDTTASVTMANDSSEEAKLANAFPCSEDHGHGTGQIEALYAEDGSVERFICTYNSHHICYDNDADGAWDECTFPPDVMMWPPAISSDVLQDPPKAEEQSAN